MQPRILILESCTLKNTHFKRELPTADIATTLVEAHELANKNDYDILFLGCWLDGVRDSANEFLKTRFHGNAEAWAKTYKLDNLIVIVHADYPDSGVKLAALSNGLWIPFKHINWKGLKKCLRINE